MVFFFFCQMSRQAELGEMLWEAEWGGQPHKTGVCLTFPIVHGYQKFQTHGEQRVLLQNTHTPTQTYHTATTFLFRFSCSIWVDDKQI